MTQDAPNSGSSLPLPVGLLWQRYWLPAARLFWSRIGESQAISCDKFAADFWSGKKERSKVACSALADLLFGAGHGEEALAALMLAADPEKPQTFEMVLPQLTYAIEHFWHWPTASADRQPTLRRLGVWSRAANGDFEDNRRSIFSITHLESLDQSVPSNEPPASREPSIGGQQDGPEESGLVVMPKDIRRAVRVLAMVGELHRRGFQKLRVMPFMSPSGNAWRCWIGPETLFYRTMAPT